MKSTPTPHTPESWDAASRGYAEKISPSITQGYADELVEFLEVDSSSEALEVGAGSGALTETLAGQVRSLLATDFSPKMVELLRERMRTITATNVTCEVMDGQSLQVQDASFDRAASNFALMLFPDRVKAFSELRRVLRPGGCAVVSGWAGPDRFEVFGLLLESLRTAFPHMPPPAEPPPIFSLADPKEFKAQMEGVGFNDVEVKFVSREVEVASVEDLWGMATVGAPAVQVLLDRIGPEGCERLRSVLGEIVSRRFGSGPIRLTNVATVGRGRVN